MTKPRAICIEDLDARAEASRYLRCVALPGRQAGLSLDQAGCVLWQADTVACELWVSADDRLILYRQEGMAPVVLRRGSRSLDVPYGKPVVVLDKDQIEVGPRFLRLHIHGEAASVDAPSPLPSRTRHGGRFAQTAATAALLGAMASSSGCTEMEQTRQITETREIEVRVTVPEIVREVTVVVTEPPPSDVAARADATASLLRDFVGEYVSASDGAELRIAITPAGAYNFVRTEPSGAEHRSEGTLFALKNLVWFDERGADSAALVPVMWGERRYLVNAGVLGRFCAVDSGEPRTTRRGEYYLRDGDWSLPVEGGPVNLDGGEVCLQ